MACTSVTLSSILAECDSTKGGIQKVWAFNKNDVATHTITDGKYSALTLATSAQMYEYTFRKESGRLVSTYTIDKANGIKYVTNVLTLRFPKMATAKRVSLTAMAEGALCFIVLDKNGTYWGLGIEDNDDAMTLNGGEGDTGTAIGDGNYYNLEFSGDSDGMPFEVPATIMETLLD